MGWVGQKGSGVPPGPPGGAPDLSQLGILQEGWEGSGCPPRGPEGVGRNGRGWEAPPVGPGGLGGLSGGFILWALLGVSRPIPSFWEGSEGRPRARRDLVVFSEGREWSGGPAGGAGGVGTSF